MWGAELTPRAQSHCLRQPFPARKQPGTLRGTHRSPGRGRHRRGGGRGPRSSPVFPLSQTGHKARHPQFIPGGRDGAGGLLSAAGRAPPAGAGWRWAQPRLGVCCTSLGSQHVQTAAGGLVPARPHASGTTAARKPGLQGDFAAKVPRPGPSTTAAEQDKLTPWGPSAHLCPAPAWAGSQPGWRPAPVSSRGPLTVVGEGARGRKARRGRGPAGRGRRARERAGVGVS